MDFAQPPPTVQAARQRRLALGQALIRLEAALAKPAPSAAWTAGVRQALDDVRTAFDDHVEVTQGTEGLFEDVLAATPRLRGAVTRLADEHDEILRGLDTARTLVDRADAASVRDCALAVLERLVRHRQRGADLVWEAFDVDIGGGG